MSWASIVNKKDSNNKKKTYIKTKKKEIKEEDTISSKEIFEQKYDLDLWDFCFDLKDHIDKNVCDILLNIESYQISEFIKQYIDYSKYKLDYIDSESENSDNEI